MFKLLKLVLLFIKFTPKTLPITTILNIAKDVNRDYDTRKRTILLLIVRLFIAPVSGGHRVSSTFIPSLQTALGIDLSGGALDVPVMAISSNLMHDVSFIYNDIDIQNKFILCKIEN